MRNKVMGVMFGSLGLVLALGLTAAAQPADPEEEAAEEDLETEAEAEAGEERGDIPGVEATRMEPRRAVLALTQPTSRAIATSCPAVRARMRTFVNNHCLWAPRGSTCAVDRTGRYSAQRSASSLQCWVDHMSGNGLTVNAYSGGSLVGTAFHPPGTRVLYGTGASGFAPQQRRFVISNALGDRYNVACRWH
jgi:hypothetical protein